MYLTYFKQSIEKPIPKRYGLIYSITLLEHVPNNRAALQSMYESLENSGLMLHYIPSKFHPYALILRLIGPKLQRLLIRWTRPDAVDVSGYPAFWNYCSPTQMFNLCRDIGFAKIEIRNYYRANDYFAFFVPFFLLVSFFENICKYLNLNIFSSGFILIAEKFKS